MMANSSNVSNDSLAGCLDNTLVPTATQAFEAHSKVLFGFAITATAYAIIIYIVRVTRDKPPFKDVALYRSHAAILSLPSCIAAVNLCAVFVPRSLVVAGLVQNVFFSFVIARFLSLLIRSLGGREQALVDLKGTQMQCGAAVPGCGICCKFCCPTPPFSQTSFVWIGYCIYQYCILQPIISFLSAVLYNNGDYIEGLVSINNAFIYLKCLQVISMMLCFHCLTVLKIMAKEKLSKEYNVSFKFFVLKATLVLLNFQGLIFGILGRVGAFNCDQYFSEATVAIYYFSFALIFEMVIIGSFAVFLAFPFSIRLDTLEELTGESIQLRYAKPTEA